MSLANFEKHLRDSSPGFHCYESGSSKSEDVKFLARVKNRIGSPGSAKTITTVRKLVGDHVNSLIRFVELHDGVLLYADNKSDAVGVEFFKVATWRKHTKEMKESMIDMGFDDSEMPEWFSSGIVFAEIPHSANYFVLQIHGKEAGKVFYCDHDDFVTDAIAPTFEKFLQMIIKDPPSFLYKCGCYTRYSDGKTDVQWIPKKYVPNCKSIKD